MFLDPYKAAKIDCKANQRKNSYTKDLLPCYPKEFTLSSFQQQQVLVQERGMNILAKNSPSPDASDDLPPECIHAEPAFALKIELTSQRPQGP
jgi:hypothetical protein